MADAKGLADCEWRVVKPEYEWGMERRGTAKGNGHRQATVYGREQAVGGSRQSERLLPLQLKHFAASVGSVSWQMYTHTRTLIEIGSVEMKCI